MPWFICRVRTSRARLFRRASARCQLRWRGDPRLRQGIASYLARTHSRLIWDRLRAHHIETGRRLAGHHRRDARALCPASGTYAPELDPVELIWGYAKTHPLANFSPLELHDLVMQTQLVIYAIGDYRSLLCSFIQHCSLSLRLK